MSPAVAKEKKRVHNAAQTRAKILEAAFEEIHLKGFQGTSIDAILAQTGLTKGALFHHFANKLELGYAVVDEVIMQGMRERWIGPLESEANPVDVICAIIETQCKEMKDKMHLGCPLNNLMQEMSPLDEGFRERISQLVEWWIDTIAEALQRGIDNKQIKKTVDPQATAAFLVTTFEGASGLMKNCRDPKRIQQIIACVMDYLQSLKK